METERCSGVCGAAAAVRCAAEGLRWDMVTEVRVFIPRVVARLATKFSKLAGPSLMEGPTTGVP